MTRGARWGWVVVAVASTAAALVLTFVLSFATPGGFYERHFVWLFRINVAVALLLLVVLGYVAVRLLARLRQGKFGSRLLLRLAGIFALVGLLPGLVIYTVSYQFATRSIEAWFDLRVAGALDAGLALGKGTLEALSQDLVAKTRVAAERVAETAEPTMPLALERVREQIGALEVALLGPGGQPLALAGAGRAAVTPERPAALLRQARAGGTASQVEGLDEDALAAGVQPRLRALARVAGTRIALAPPEERYLMVVAPLPRPLAANALAVQAAYSEYQQRALARESLRRMYVGTLTLALLLAVFTAVLLAIALGTQLARPLLLLAEGVRQVARGDYTAKPVFEGGDELGGLTRSFADMTAQVAEAREQVQRGIVQLEGARTRLQTILDTLSAGVIVFDRDGRIDVVNPGAARILQQPLEALHGRSLADAGGLGTFAAEIDQRFELLRASPEPGERDQWQESLELARGDGARLTLLVRGATLPGAARLVVFDDITDIVSAQRSAAWAEVARRLAHEIRNPLTPIQLSAERLQARLENKLDAGDQALLRRSVATIVAQVGSMQALVSEFRDYARLPAAQVRPLDLNALVTEVMALYGQAIDNGLLSVRTEPGLPRILGDPSQLRQVVHNLVQNALDAVADRPDGQVEVATSSARGHGGELRAVRLAVLDNGPGFPDKVLKRAFEPYVTTKAKGTGLGLAVVRKIADEHGARIAAVNLRADDGADAPVTGARVSLSFSRFVPETAATPEPAAHAGTPTPDTPPGRAAPRARTQ
ncbi:MAG: ATP-binding protein [Pseudomonadota bacterium]|jgi:PAS domain S-box-containing protein|nr:HAMP domain-containing protein [Rubrivivax sp.]MCA3260288.1 HAMP domain-containing protein [Rubrivivax sp.]MCZ8031487.1 ATP-binding protein [Rubrivivax sp.]